MEKIKYLSPQFYLHLLIHAMNKNMIKNRFTVISYKKINDQIVIFHIRLFQFPNISYIVLRM